ncbi:MAG: hypothetical protein AAF636_14925 [Pseudomonadota bacterium]
MISSALKTSIALALVAIPCVGLALGQPSETDATAMCTDRLARSLAEMERRPLLKEELATGLMWLRLDAETARDAGDTETCLEKAEIVETILGIGPPAD